MSKSIPLTRGQFAIVDDADFDWLNQWKWYAAWQPLGQCYYALRRPSVWTGKRPTIIMHRFILAAPDGMKVEHENHNTLDNQRHNIRIATHAQNMHNSRKRRNNTTGFKGVCWQSERRKFYAQICLNRKNKFLGYFDKPEDAHAAYVKAATELHGKFACKG